MHREPLEPLVEAHTDEPGSLLRSLPWGRQFQLASALQATGFPKSHSCVFFIVMKATDCLPLPLNDPTLLIFVSRHEICLYVCALPCMLCTGDRTLNTHELQKAARLTISVNAAVTVVLYVVDGFVGVLAMMPHRSCFYHVTSVPCMFVFTPTHTSVFLTSPSPLTCC